MSRKTTHVVHAPEGGWNVKQGGASRASCHFDTKVEAEQRGRQISSNLGSELYIHDRHGKIIEKDRHGGDPHRPRG